MTVRRGLNILRAAPMWGLSLALAIALVLGNLTVPEDPSTGGMVAAIIVYLALLALLVAAKGEDGLGLVGLLTVSGWVIRAVDFPRAAEMVVFVVALTAYGYGLDRLSDDADAARGDATRES
jgi:hypothetical protein